jgi:hypothetical protein
MSAKVTRLGIAAAITIALLLPGTGWAQASAAAQTSIQGVLSDMTGNTFNLIFTCSYDANKFIKEGDVSNGAKAFVWCYKNMGGAPSQKVVCAEPGKPFPSGATLMGIIGDWTDKSFTVKVPFTYQSSAIAYPGTCNGDKARVEWYIGGNPPWEATGITVSARDPRKRMR